MGSYLEKITIIKQLSHLISLFPIDPQHIYAFGT